MTGSFGVEVTDGGVNGMEKEAAVVKDCGEKEDAGYSTMQPSHIGDEHDFFYIIIMNGVLY